MPHDDDDDLYDEEFDFVDDDDDDLDEPEEEAAADDTDIADDGSDFGDRDDRREMIDEPAAEAPGEPQEDEYGRTAPAANYVVHVYENKRFKRTIDRPFTPEDAEAFATEYNRTNKNYSRWAMTGKNDVQPKKTLD